MAGYISDDTRKVTTHRLVEMKQRGEKISMLTAYDYTMAQIVDGAGMDVILVGSYTFGKSSGNLFENNGETTRFFKQMSVTNQFVRFSIVLGTHSIGYVTTLPITLDQMIYHAKSVVRGVKRAMVVVDMPFGSYQGNEMLLQADERHESVCPLQHRPWHAQYRFRIY